MPILEIVIYNEDPGPCGKICPVAVRILEHGRDILRVRRHIKGRYSLLLEDFGPDRLIGPVHIRLGIILLGNVLSLPKNTYISGWYRS